MPDGTAFTVSRIQLDDGADKESFENYFFADVLPVLVSDPDGLPTDQHFLVDDVGSVDVAPRGYFVLSVLGYGIHQTPVPVWLQQQVDRVRKLLDDTLEGRATRVSSELFYDVGSWRRVVGEPT